MRLLLLCLVCSCDYNFWSQDQYPADFPCSDANTCPPGEVCVPGEQMCRRPCTHPGNSCMNGGPCECGGMNMNDICDVDSFCRPMCSGGPPGQGCGTGDCSNPMLHCDTTTNICRQPCGAACPKGFFCSTASGCSTCKPSGVGLPDGGSDGGGGSDLGNGNGVIADSLPGVRLLAIDHGRLVFDKQGDVLSCPASDCSQRITLGSSPGMTITGLAAANDLAMWTDSNGNVFSCLSVGCGGMPHLVAKGQTGAGPIAGDGINAYWTAASPGPAVTLYACGVPNCDAGAQPLTSFGGSSARSAMATANGFLLWDSDHNVLRCTTSGCGSMPLPIANFPSGVGAIAIGIGAMATGFFSSGDCISNCDLTNCTAVQFACNGGPQNVVQAMVSDGLTLYWTIPSGVRRCSVTNCGNMPQSLAGSGSAAGIAIDNTFVYWADSVAGTISRIAR